MSSAADVRTLVPVGVLRRTDASQFFFCLAFVAYTLSSIGNNVNFSGSELASAFLFIKPLLQLLAGGCLTIKLLLQRYTAPRAALAVAIIVCGVLTWRANGSAMMLWLAFFIAAGQDVTITKLSRLVLATTVICAGVVLMLLFLEVIADAARMRADESMRSSLGFRHPNYLGLVLLTACSTYLVAGYKHPRWIQAAICVAAAAVTLVVADSRTVAIVLMLLAVIVVFMPALQRLGARKVAAITCGVFVLLLAASMWLMVAYNPDDAATSFVNKAISGRPYFMNFYYKTAGITLFGANSENLYLGGTDTVVLDNMYCNVLLQFGLIPSLLVFVGIAAVCIKYGRECLKTPAIWVFLVFLIYGFTESFGLAITSNIYLLSLSTLVYGRPLSSFDDSRYVATTGLFGRGAWS